VEESGVRPVSFPPQSGTILADELLPGEASQIPHEVPECSTSREAGIVVLYIVVLAALALVAGFKIGQRGSRWAGVAAGVALAFLSALVLRKVGLSPGIGIPAVAAVLAISQAAYLIGLMRSGRSLVGARFLPDQEVDDVPDDRRDGDVSHDHEGQQETPFHTAKIERRRDTSRLK
jgi:hypothetical protein